MLGPYWVGDRPRDTIDVAIVRDGEPVDLSGYDGATMELRSPYGLVDTSNALVTLGADAVSITWPLEGSVFSVPGVYTLQVSLTSGSSTERASEVLLEVLAPSEAPVAPLASPSALRELLHGKSYTDEQIISALRIATTLVRAATGRQKSWATSVPPGLAFATALIAKRILSLPTVETTETVGPFRTTTKPSPWIGPDEASMLAPFTRRTGVDSTTFARAGRRRKFTLDEWGEPAWSAKS